MPANSYQWPNLSILSFAPMFGSFWRGDAGCKLGWIWDVEQGGDYRVVASSGWQRGALEVAVAYRHDVGSRCPAASELGNACEFHPYRTCNLGIVNPLMEGVRGCGPEQCVKAPDTAYPVCLGCGGDCGGCVGDPCQSDVDCAPRRVCSRRRCALSAECSWLPELLVDTGGVCWRASAAGDYGIDRHVPCEELVCDVLREGPPDHDMCAEARSDRILREFGSTLSDGYGSLCSKSWVLEMRGLVASPNQFVHVAAEPYPSFAYQTQGGCEASYLKASVWKKQDDGTHLKVTESTSRGVWRQGLLGQPACSWQELDLVDPVLTAGGDFKVIASAGDRCNTHPLRVSTWIPPGATP